jgi:hypothetical protein
VPKEVEASDCIFNIGNEPCSKSFERSDPDGCGLSTAADKDESRALCDRWWQGTRDCFDLL